MGSGQGMSPAFGTANLSNCEREQIHLAASIQPYGALLLVREPDGVPLLLGVWLGEGELLGVTDGVGVPLGLGCVIELSNGVSDMERISVLAGDVTSRFHAPAVLPASSVFTNTP